MHWKFLIPNNLILSIFFFRQIHHLTRHLNKKHTSELKFLSGDEKIYKCADCPKSFNKPNNLAVHQRMHSVEKPYKCEICQREFSQKHHVLRHMQSQHNENNEIPNLKTEEIPFVHSDEKPFKCEICQNGFGLKHNLLKHMKQQHEINGYVHLKNEEKPFKCQFCVKAFTRKYNLNAHVRYDFT